ncbi:MAG: homoserine kinase [Streptosporangiaceae bacterium]|jgi:homoserine kinase
MNWLANPVEVRVPATSANLGPGFDSLALALARYDVVTARITGGGLTIEVSGEGQGTAADGERHLVVRAMRAAFGVLGGQPPGIGLRCVNDIPQGRGLGSSAAAIVSGLLAARALAGGGCAVGVADVPGVAGVAGVADVGGLTDLELLRLAVALEGHPDNVSACLAGELVISWTSASGAGFARLATVAGLAPVLCVPDSELSTSAARQALPAAVPHADAAANSARAALLVTALTSDPGLLMVATEDFLHQCYRAAAMPGTASLVSALRGAGIPAVVSGAGPAVLALTIAGRCPGPREVAAVAADQGASWLVRPVKVDSSGAVVRVAADARPGS